jgi:2'-5' RNA ligase
VSEETVRAFVAVVLPDPVRATIVEVAGRLRPQLPRASWVRPETLHLTVKFLGDVDADELVGFGDDAERAVASSGPVAVRLAGGGFFPSAGRPRVAWIGGEAPGLEPIAGVVDELAARRGVERERRRWTPHLTVARLRDPWSATDVERFREAVDALGVLDFQCSELVVFSSRLEPSGAVHTPLRSLTLA